MSEMESFFSNRAPAPVGAYPHAKRVGNLLFLSGVGPRRPGQTDIPGVTLNAAGEVTDYDIKAQCESTFENVRRILEDAGAKWENIVDVTCFLTDMKADFKTYNESYARHFKDSQPTRTTIEVGALPTPIAFEIKVIAAL